MTEVALDASVVIKWFRTQGERHHGQAQALRAAFEAGELVVLAPRLIVLEILNVAGRRWHWEEQALLELAAALDDLGFELLDPTTSGVARWTARGLRAHEAAYVAVAHEHGVQLVTDDDGIVRSAGDVARPLARVS